MATNPIYRGYSSVKRRGINTECYDIDLVSQDLLNEFNTRLGDRLGRPTYGSIIQDLLFDLGDPRTESLITADAERIIGNDPRVRLLELEVNTNLKSHNITLNANLSYIELNINDFFTVTFQERL